MSRRPTRFQRAEQLLLQYLDRSQKTQWRTYRFFDVPVRHMRGKVAHGAKARINGSSLVANVYLLQPYPPRTKLLDAPTTKWTVRRFCVILDFDEDYNGDEHWPRCDVLLAQKLLIETDLPKFFRKASNYGVTRYPPIGGKENLGTFVLPRPENYGY